EWSGCLGHSRHDRGGRGRLVIPRSPTRRGRQGPSRYARRPSLDDVFQISTTVHSNQTIRAELVPRTGHLPDNAPCALRCGFSSMLPFAAVYKLERRPIPCATTRLLGAANYVRKEGVIPARYGTAVGSYQEAGVDIEAAERAVELM